MNATAGAVGSVSGIGKGIVKAADSRTAKPVWYTATIAMRILIVEDDSRIAESVAEHLRKQHHVVEIRNDGRSGLEFARMGVYDLVLLDVMLPGLDGLSLCRRMRELQSTAPVMMLTARDTIDDKVAALDAGADDYLAKPFSLAELSARVRALGRRGPEFRQPVLCRGALELDRQAMRVKYAGRDLCLTPTEFAILETLLRSPRQVFSREMLLDKIAPFDSNTGDESIKMHVANLRRKIREAGCSQNPIEALYRNGYRLADLE